MFCLQPLRLLLVGRLLCGGQLLPPLPTKLAHLWHPWVSTNLLGQSLAVIGEPEPVRRRGPFGLVRVLGRPFARLLLAPFRLRLLPLLLPLPDLTARGPVLLKLLLIRSLELLGLLLVGGLLGL